MSPALPEDLVEEVLLRFPPEDPALLLRAALVCKDWHRLVSDPGFRRRFHHRHGIPSLLGYFCHRDALPSVYHRDKPPCFEPTSSFRPPYAARRGWEILNARHGRVLALSSEGRDKELVVWDPATDEQRRLPMPPVNHTSWNAALLCAPPAGCDHFGCPGRPFLVVFVCRHDSEQGMNMSACVYSSEQGAWGERVYILHHGWCGMRRRGPNVLVGNAIYFGCDIKTGFLLEYDLGKQELSMIGLPPLLSWQHFVLMTAEDGGLGLAHCREYELCLWSRVAAGRTGDATWTLHRVIELDKAALHIRDLSTSPYVYTVAIADDVGVVFIWVDKVLLNIDLRSSRIEKVGYVDFAFGVVPYMNVYTLALQAAFTGEETRAVASSAWKI